MKKIFRIVIGIACMFMLFGTAASCITIQPPSITSEERVLVEKILARRVGYEITKKYTWISRDLETLSNKTIEILMGASTDEAINTAINSFVEELTSGYLSNDPMLEQDVLDLAEVLMPTVSVETGEDLFPLDENLKSELIAIFKAFNEGVRIANEQDAK